MPLPQCSTSGDQRGCRPHLERLWILLSCLVMACICRDKVDLYQTNRVYGYLYTLMVRCRGANSMRTPTLLPAKHCIF